MQGLTRVPASALSAISRGTAPVVLLVAVSVVPGGIASQIGTMTFVLESKKTKQTHSNYLYHISEKEID